MYFLATSVAAGSNWMLVSLALAKACWKSLWKAERDDDRLPLVRLVVLEAVCRRCHLSSSEHLAEAVVPVAVVVTLEVVNEWLAVCMVLLLHLDPEVAKVVDSVESACSCPTAFATCRAYCRLAVAVELLVAEKAVLELELKLLALVLEVVLLVVAASA